MNKNHPSQNYLDQLASGKLDDCISVIISAHTGSCKQCQNYLSSKERSLANTYFNSDDIDNTDVIVPDFTQMEEAIFESSPKPKAMSSHKRVTPTLKFKNKNIPLPQQLLSIKEHMSPWKSFGNISYSKVNVAENGSLYFVHFEPGAKIAEHTHDGNEYAYVVAGSFKDQHSEYITGDFASFGQDDSHHPHTEDPDGCMLLVSLDGPFFFKEGFARILNPFRNLFFKKL